MRKSPPPTVINISCSCSRSLDPRSLVRGSPYVYSYKKKIQWAICSRTFASNSMLFTFDGRPPPAILPWCRKLQLVASSSTFPKDSVLEPFRRVLPRTGDSPEHQRNHDSGNTTGRRRDVLALKLIYRREIHENSMIEKENVQGTYTCMYCSGNDHQKSRCAP